MNDSRILFITNDSFDLLHSRVPFALYLEARGKIKVDLSLFSNESNSDYLSYPKTLRGIYNLNKQINTNSYTHIIVRTIELSVILGPILLFNTANKRIVYITGLGRMWGNKLTLKRRVFRVLYLSYLRILKVSGIKFWVQNDDDFRDLGLENYGSILNGSGIRLPDMSLKSIKYNQILFAGRITYEKGFDDLITLASKLPDKWNLVLCGNLDPGISKRDLSIFNDLIAERKIIYHGFVQDLSELLEYSSFAFYPTSYREGTPRFVLEAMCHGLIPIIPYVPGCKRLLSEGLAFDLEDEDWLTDLVNMSDETYLDWTDHNYSLIERVYSQEVVFQEKFKLLCSY